MCVRSSAKSASLATKALANSRSCRASARRRRSSHRKCLCAFSPSALQSRSHSGHGEGGIADRVFGSTSCQRQWLILAPVLGRMLLQFQSPALDVFPCEPCFGQTFLESWTWVGLGEFVHHLYMAIHRCQVGYLEAVFFSTQHRSMMAGERLSN